ncbi:MAG: hypothetical protein KF773_25595 [Deltaproteobacteria bacterium]|nr:hypothetical protein [Deltaproteobacteria bacterium]MCW5805960.1 hypothetical protein [Deltaproteobacteria bacterium]
MKDPLAFLPADSEIVIDADLSRVKSSALWRHVEPIVYGHAGEDLARFRELCGFDPLAQLGRVTFAMRGLDAPRATGVFVLRGLDKKGTMGCLKKNLTAERRIKIYNDNIAYVQPELGEDPVAFGFANDRTLVVLVGPTASPTELTKVFAAGAPLRKSAAFQALYKQIEPNREVWFVMNAKNAFARLAELGVQTRTLTGAISLANGVQATLRMRVASPDQAREVAAALQSAFSQGSLVDNIKVSSEQSDIVGHVTMSESQVAALTETENESR